MQFVVLADHTPDMCPTSNAKIRDMMKQAAKEIPNVAGKLGVKLLSTHVFGPEHRMMALVEANDIEAVRNFAMESRMVQWSTVHIHPTWTLEEAMAKADKLPTMF